MCVFQDAAQVTSPFLTVCISTCRLRQAPSNAINTLPALHSSTTTCSIFRLDLASEALALHYFPPNSIILIQNIRLSGPTKHDKLYVNSSCSCWECGLWTNARLIFQHGSYGPPPSHVLDSIIFNWHLQGGTIQHQIPVSSRWLFRCGRNARHDFKRKVKHLWTCTDLVYMLPGWNGGRLCMSCEWRLRNVAKTNGQTT